MHTTLFMIIYHSSLFSCNKLLILLNKSLNTNLIVDTSSFIRNIITLKVIILPFPLRKTKWHDLLCLHAELIKHFNASMPMSNTCNGITNVAGDSISLKIHLGHAAVNQLKHNVICLNKPTDSWYFLALRQYSSSGFGKAQTQITFIIASHTKRIVTLLLFLQNMRHVTIQTGSVWNVHVYRWNSAFPNIPTEQW